MHFHCKTDFVCWSNEASTTHLIPSLCIITARKRSLGQGNIFYTCLSFCSQGGYLLPGGGEVPVLGDACSQWGLLWGGVPAPGKGGACSRRGGCLVETHHPYPRTATAAGGTHPTGMHACSICNDKVRA